jgi:TPR repeat protein
MEVIALLKNSRFFRYGMILTIAVTSLLIALPRQTFSGSAPDDLVLNAKEQFLLGMRHCRGDGVTHDYKKGVEWFRKAAEQGFADAQYRLGWMYEHGKGVPRDYKKAVRWYREAEKQNHAYAQFHLGLMYAFGQGVTQDYKEAAKLYRKAAEQGNADAQGRLGYIYKIGEGIPKNYIRAYAWSNLAASRGDVITAQFRDELAKSYMTLEQIAAGQELTHKLQNKIYYRH